MSSVIGGLFGYAIGYYLYETVGKWLIDFYSLQGGIDTFREQFNEYGFWIILVKGLTPIPYKIVTIACGIASYSIPMFVLASVITRGARFFIVAALLQRAEPSLCLFKLLRELVALCTRLVSFHLHLLELLLQLLDVSSFLGVQVSFQWGH